MVHYDLSDEAGAIIQPLLPAELSIPRAGHRLPRVIYTQEVIATVREKRRLDIWDQIQKLNYL